MLISLVLSHLMQILTQGKNPGITWKYALPKILNATQPAAKRYHHTWRTVQSDCSVTCGGGNWQLGTLCPSSSLLAGVIQATEGHYELLGTAGRFRSMSLGNESV